jgi:UDP-glucose 4-epimerase
MPAEADRILLTGGAGYIGSHTYLALVEAGYAPVILDDFSNSSPEVIDRLAELSGAPVVLEQGDVGDGAFLAALFVRHRIAAAIHFAAFKSPAESVAKPLAYYRNNLLGLISLAEAMTAAGCRNLVFSSSAAVYGADAAMPVTEQAARMPANPYGHTKAVGEDMLAALAASDPGWRIAILRYFNPAGAHPSGRIGESPIGPPANLVPFVSQVAAGRRPVLKVFGEDYPTPDGTGVRDYIHVLDLAEGHVAALRHLLGGGAGGIFNLGTGRGHSVREVVRAFERACGHSIPIEIAPRRPGDVAVSYADAGRAARILDWRASRTLDAMCEDAWRWQSANPDGFALLKKGSP